MAKVKKKSEKWVLEKGFSGNYQFVSEFPSPDAIFRYIASNLRKWRNEHGKNDP